MLPSTFAVRVPPALALCVLLRLHARPQWICNWNHDGATAREKYLRRRSPQT